MMADIFLRKDFYRLFDGKRIVFVGDSNMRALYKDFVQLGLNHVLTGMDKLRAKLENSCNGDRLVFSGQKHNGRDIAEERVMEHDRFSARFFFVTKCYNDYIVNMLRNVVSNFQPNVIVFNSCIWDITRWGPRGVDVYKENIPKLMRLLQELLPRSTLFIWCTALPVSSKLRGGFLIQQVEFLKHTLRFDIMEANLYASKVVEDHGFDVLDLHYYLRYQIHRRAKDGIHWLSEPMRHITNLLLTHISLAWDAPLPSRFESRLLHNAVNIEDDDKDRSKIGPFPLDSQRPLFHEDFTSDVILNASVPFFSAQTTNHQRFQTCDDRQEQRLPLNPFSVPQQPRRKCNTPKTRRSNRRCTPKQSRSTATQRVPRNRGSVKRILSPVRTATRSRNQRRN